MTAPVRFDPPTRRRTFDYVGFAKAARQQGVPLDEIARVLTEEGHGDYATELLRAREPSGTNFVGQVAENLPMGLGRPLQALGGAAVQKLSGDDRDFGAIYAQLKADADNRSAAYVDANPKKALGAAVLAGVSSARLNPALFANRVMQPLSRSTVLGRAGNAALGSGTASAVAGAANADGDVGDRARAGATAGALGTLAGGVLSPVMDAGGATGRFLSGQLPERVRARVGRTANRLLEGPARVLEGAADALDTETAGPTRRAAAEGLRALTSRQAGPVDPGVARLITRLQAQGLSLDDLERLSQQADGPDLLAEVIGQRGIDDLNAARNLGHTAPDAAKAALDLRAGGEADRWLDVLERLMPTPTVDPKTYATQRTAAADAVANPLYAQATPRPVPAEATEGVMDRIAQLRADGIDLWKLAKVADEGMPAMPSLEPNPLGERELPALSVGQWQRLRQAADKLAQYGETEAPAYAIERQAIGRLRSIRDDIDQLAKGYGGQPMVDADAAVAQGQTASEAFASGYRAAQLARSADEVARLAQQSRDPEAFREGIAAYRQQQVQAVRDGGAGSVQNPFTPAMGSPRNRMITRAGLRDATAMPELERLAERGAARLSTRNQVLGGSPTAQRALSAAEAMTGTVDGADVAQALTNPQGVATRGLSALWDQAQRRAVGRDMDAYANVLLAGAPERMTRELMLQRVRALAPLLESQWAQEVFLRGRMGQTAGEQLRR